MTTIDIKNISVYSFLEIANAKWIISEYLKSIPEVKAEYFSENEENDILSSNEFINLENSINIKFAWK